MRGGGGGNVVGPVNSAPDAVVSLVDAVVGTSGSVERSPNVPGMNELGTDGGAGEAVAGGAGSRSVDEAVLVRGAAVGGVVRGALMMRVTGSSSGGSGAKPLRTGSASGPSSSARNSASVCGRSCGPHRERGVDRAQEARAVAARGEPASGCSRSSIRRSTDDIGALPVIAK